MFVGDSLNRNMWESLVCILRNSVADKSKVFEASGKEEFRAEGSYSFIFAVCYLGSVFDDFLVPRTGIFAFSAKFIAVINL